MPTYSLTFHTYSGMPIPFDEGLTLAEVRQRLAQVIRARRKLGQEVTKIGDLEYEFQFTDPVLISDIDGVLRADTDPYEVCDRCGEEYPPKDGFRLFDIPDMQFCSEYCADEYDLADTEEYRGMTQHSDPNRPLTPCETCKHCGKEFPAGTGFRLYFRGQDEGSFCSADCANTYDREARGE